MTIEQIRDFCNSLPAVTEAVKWEHDLGFSVCDKLFLITGFEPDSAATIKVPDEQYAELIEQPGISSAPYLGRFKWVQVEQRSSLSKKEWEHLIRQSYELIRNKLPKKVLKEHGLA